MTSTQTIPLLDLSECSALLEDENSVIEETSAAFGKKLYDALSTSGFAYLSNHGIPKHKIEAAEEIAEKIFSLPTEEKMKFYAHSFDYSYDPIYCTKANMKLKDYYEGFRMTGVAFGDNDIQWPDIPNFRAISFDLTEDFKNLMFRLLGVLGTGMKLKEKGYFRKAHSLANKPGNGTMLKFMHYPPVETDEMLPDKTTRIGEHSDFTSISFLLQDSNGGLQVETEKGVYVDVPPIPGTIVVNVGDTMEKWSGGRLRATVHRVVPPKDPEKRKNSRRSILYFGQANEDVLMEPLLFDDGNVDVVESKDKPLTVKQYTKKRFDEAFH